MKFYKKYNNSGPDGTIPVLPTNVVAFNQGDVDYVFSSADSRMVRCYLNPNKTSITMGGFGCAGKDNARQKRVAQVMATLPKAEQADFYMNVGDIVYPIGLNLDDIEAALKDIKRFLPKIYGKVPAPFFLTTGNHEANLCAWALLRSTDPGFKIQHKGERSYSAAKAKMDGFVKAVTLHDVGFSLELKDTSDPENPTTKTFIVETANDIAGLMGVLSVDLKKFLAGKLTAVIKRLADTLTTKLVGVAKLSEQSLIKKLHKFDESIEQLKLLSAELKALRNSNIIVKAIHEQDESKARFLMPDRYFLKEIYAQGDGKKPAAFVLYLDSSLLPIEVLQNIHGKLSPGFNRKILTWLKEVIKEINQNADVPLVLALHHPPTHTPGRRAVSKSDAKKYFIKTPGNHNRYVAKALEDLGLKLSRVNSVVAAHDHTTVIQDIHDWLGMEDLSASVEDAAPIPSTSTGYTVPRHHAVQPVMLEQQSSSVGALTLDRPKLSIIAGGAGSEANNHDCAVAIPGLQNISSEPAFITLELNFVEKHLTVNMYDCNELNDAAQNQTGPSLSFSEALSAPSSSAPYRSKVTYTYDYAGKLVSANRSGKNLLLPEFHPRMFYPEVYAQDKYAIKHPNFHRKIAAWREKVLLPILETGNLNLLKYLIVTQTQLISDFEKQKIDAGSQSFDLLFAQKQERFSLSDVKSFMRSLYQLMCQFARHDIPVCFTTSYAQIALLYTALDLVRAKMKPGNKSFAAACSEVKDLIIGLKPKKKTLQALFAKQVDGSSSDEDDPEIDEPEQASVRSGLGAKIIDVDQPADQSAVGVPSGESLNSVRLTSVNKPSVAITVGCINKENFFKSVHMAVNRFLDSAHQINLVCVIDEMDQYSHVASCFLLLALLKESENPLLTLKAFLSQCHAVIEYTDLKLVMPMQYLTACIYQQIGDDFEAIFGEKVDASLLGNVKAGYEQYQMNAARVRLLALSEIAKNSIESIAFLDSRYSVQRELLQQCFSLKYAGRAFSSWGIKKQLGKIIGIDFEVNRIVSGFQRLYTSAVNGSAIARKLNSFSYSLLGWTGLFSKPKIAVDGLSVIKSFYTAIYKAGETSSEAAYEDFCSLFFNDLAYYFYRDEDAVNDSVPYGLTSAFTGDEFLVRLLKLFSLITKDNFDAVRGKLKTRDEMFSELSDLKIIRQKVTADVSNVPELEQSLLRTE